MLEESIPCRALVVLYSFRGDTLKEFICREPNRDCEKGIQKTSGEFAYLSLQRSNVEKWQRLIGYLRVVTIDQRSEDIGRRMRPGWCQGVLHAFELASHLPSDLVEFRSLNLRDSGWLRQSWRVL